MKRLKTALLCAAAVTLMSAPAKAESDFYFKPYVGAEYQHTVIDYATLEGIDFDDVFENNFNGGAIYLGARIHDHLGVEVGYNRTTEEDVNNVLGTGANTSLKLQSFTLDLLGYYPVDEAEKLELIGAVGLARTEAEAEIDATSIGFSSARGDETEIKLRLGAGAQYEFVQDWNLRVMVRWQDADFEDSADNAYIPITLQDANIGALIM
ncbi:MAG: outer membrane beta-barrel protein [Gammaproteobacteria bacterium]|nr:outer membrane beta-barrel protein [Gammaproteobacteria bacterium]